MGMKRTARTNERRQFCPVFRTSPRKPKPGVRPLVSRHRLRTYSNRNQLRTAPGILNGFDSVFGRESAHDQREFTVGSGLNRSQNRSAAHIPEHGYRHDLL